jgi:hypothetical protein
MDRKRLIFAGQLGRSNGGSELAQLEQLGRSIGYFCGAQAQKRESNQRRPIANRL